MYRSSALSKKINDHLDCVSALYICRRIYSLTTVRPPCILLHESGTGKHLYTRIEHKHRKRKFHRTLVKELSEKEPRSATISSIHTHSLYCCCFTLRYINIVISKIHMHKGVSVGPKNPVRLVDLRDLSLRGPK